jgi:tetratricopeptide (TPR) repeat protein
VKIGRNDPCVCGSGKKYKKCCGSSGFAIDFEDDVIEEKIVKVLSLMDGEKWQEAINICQKILPKTKDSAKVLGLIASCYEGMDDYIHSIEFFQKALCYCKEEEKFDILYYLGVSYGLSQNPKKSIECFSQCLFLNEKKAEEINIPKIIEEFKLVLKGVRSQSAFLVFYKLKRIFSNLEAKQYAKAIVKLEKLSKIDKQNEIIFFNLGVSHYLSGNIKEAILNYEKAISFYKEYYQAYFNLGQIYMENLKDNEKAIEYFKKAISIKHDYIHGYNQIGLAYERLGQASMAVSFWEKTLKLDPNYNNARKNLERVKTIQNVTRD